MKNDLTKGNVLSLILEFSLPFILSNFLQTFYGLADLFIIGHFNKAAEITAVSVGSQITHMLTVVIVGLSVGASVSLSHAVGAKSQKEMKKVMGNTLLIFAVFAVMLTVLLLLSTDGILSLLSVPARAFDSARIYCLICFAGVPFITAYNVLSSIYRGLGDSKTPMYFVAAAGVINIILDWILIGPFSMGTAGAALATVISQAVSVIISAFALFGKKGAVRLIRSDIAFERRIGTKILKIGIPVAVQEGFIQISFLVITVIANRRGLETAAAVGIVEKIISFLFLVPSAMMSTVAMITAQNIGAGLYERGKQTLGYCIGICLLIGSAVFVLTQFFGSDAVGLFVKDDPEVVRLGTQYFKAYALDCALGGVQFSFSGYFNAYQRSWITFMHNTLSILLVRIPGAWLASLYYPENLFPMGLAAPLGSFLSIVICVVCYRYMLKKGLTGGLS
ncbi:MAG: MATE family efflux transporter [Lachnospiraceae bacterium]|nr:MATE family efflux transporter [Lachnospiraceae bacterium]